MTFTATIKAVKVHELYREVVTPDTCRVFVRQGASKVLTATTGHPVEGDGGLVLFNEELVFSARKGPIAFAVGRKPSSPLVAELPRVEEAAAGATELVILAPGLEKGSFERVGVLTLSLRRLLTGHADERTPLTDS